LAGIRSPPRTVSYDLPDGTSTLGRVGRSWSNDEPRPALRYGPAMATASPGSSEPATNSGVDVAGARGDVAHVVVYDSPVTSGGAMRMTPSSPRPLAAYHGPCRPARRASRHQRMPGQVTSAAAIHAVTSHAIGPTALYGSA